MSDGDEVEIDRSLFRRVRQERPSEALRQRIVALGRAELSRARSAQPASRAPLAASRTRLRRASLGAFIASAAGLGALLGWCGTAAQPISISAESAAPRRAAAPPAPVPDPRMAPEQVVAVPAQSAAARAPASEPDPVARARLPQSSAQRPKPADAPSGSGMSRVTATEVEPALEPAAPAAPPQSLAEQLEHIKRARTALRAGAPERALQLIDEYQSGGGGSELAAEARLLRIEALAAAGQKDEAASEALRFATDYPTSPLIDRARSFIKP